MCVPKCSVPAIPGIVPLRKALFQCLEELRNVIHTVGVSGLELLSAGMISGLPEVCELFGYQFDGIWLVYGLQARDQRLVSDIASGGYLQQNVPMVVENCVGQYLNTAETGYPLHSS